MVLRRGDHLRSEPARPSVWSRRGKERAESVAARDHVIACQDRYVLDRGGAQLRASAQRHDAVAAAGHLSAHQGFLRSQFHADRPDHADLSIDGFAAPTVGRHIHRPAAAALFAGGRHGLHADGAGRSRARGQLFHAGARRGDGRHRLVDFSSRVDTHGASGIGRAARFCAIAVPGRRTGRPGVRSAARRVRGGAKMDRRACRGSRW